MKGMGASKGLHEATWIEAERREGGGRRGFQMAFRRRREGASKERRSCEAPFVHPSFPRRSHEASFVHRSSPRRSRDAFPSTP